MKCNAALAAPARASFRFGILDGEPLVIVSRVTSEEFKPPCDPANPVEQQVHVVRDGPHQRVVVLFNATCGFTEGQLRIVGHAMSHAAAKLLGLADTTDDVPRGEPGLEGA